jgi:peptidoglycan/xylan/chitin deacetylase (PgdA/CDA1 family)/glycosyltransferase involved in cell wall biosynthesis
MNILIALSQLEITGAEVYATEVGNVLAERGHHVFYVSDTLTKKVQGKVFRLRFNQRSLPRRLWHIAYLVYLFKRYKIQLVHAHSRAAGWSSYVACKLTGTPMVTTVHGRQPVHASRKRFHALGYRALAVCEDVAGQIVRALGVNPEAVNVVRNGIDTQKFSLRTKPQNTKPVLSIIGRLTGPKGELCYRLLDEMIDLGAWQIQVITSSAIPQRFDRFKSRVAFLAQVEDMPAVMAASDLVIGAGRVAVEALLCRTPVFAIGEAKAIGLVTEENLAQAMQSNFGDIGDSELDMDLQQVAEQLAVCVVDRKVSDTVRECLTQEYGLQVVVDRIEDIYQSAVVYTLKREMPILMYHRFIERDEERGIHGTWMWLKRFEAHLKLLKRLGYETLTFADLADKHFIHRLAYGKKYCMITADDGYRDNLTRMLPLLKKYGFKAVVYVVSDESYNRWDVEGVDKPDLRVALMDTEEIKALADSGHVEIGGHTLTHAKLDLLSAQEQAKEIQENKVQLESIINRPLHSFAYPYGRLNAEAKQQVQQAGYAYAVSTDSGPLAMHEDPYQIRRIAVFPRTDIFGLWRKVRGNYVFRRQNR